MIVDCDDGRICFNFLFFFRVCSVRKQLAHRKEKSSVPGRDGSISKRNPEGYVVFRTVNLHFYLTSERMHHQERRRRFSKPTSPNPQRPQSISEREFIPRGGAQSWLVRAPAGSFPGQGFMLTSGAWMGHASHAASFVEVRVGSCCSYCGNLAHEVTLRALLRILGRQLDLVNTAGEQRHKL